MVAVYGSTQPDKIAALMRGADDGLLSRFLWLWPEPIPFRLGRTRPGADWATASLDKLRELDLQPGAQPGAPARPIMVRLADEALPELEGFGREMQRRQVTAGGLLRSALGKTRGQALRLALVLEFLWWCGADGIGPPPAQISARAFEEARPPDQRLFRANGRANLWRCVGDPADRNAATLARWILREPKHEVHVRTLLRGERLPGLRTADDIHAAAEVLVEAEWLSPPPRGTRIRATRAGCLSGQSAAVGAGVSPLPKPADTLDTMRHSAGRSIQSVLLCQECQQGSHPPGSARSLPSSGSARMANDGILPTANF